MFLSYHYQESRSDGHASLITGFDGQYVYVNDPSKDPPDGINSKIPVNSLPVLMKSNDSIEIVRDNTFLLFAPKLSNLPLIRIDADGRAGKHSFFVFADILPEIEAFVDPYIDDWFQVSSVPACTT